MGQYDSKEAAIAGEQAVARDAFQRAENARLAGRDNEATTWNRAGDNASSRASEIYHDVIDWRDA